MVDNSKSPERKQKQNICVKVHVTESEFVTRTYDI